MGTQAHAGSRHHLELVTIYEISKILSRSLDLRRSLHDVLNLLATHLHVRRAMVCLSAGDGHDLQVVAETGLSPDEAKRAQFRTGEGIIGRIFKSGMPIVVPDINNEPLYLHRTAERPQPGEIVAFLGVPLREGTNVVGVLSVDRRTEGEPASRFDTDLRFLMMIGNLIGQTIRLHRMVEHAQENLRVENRRLATELKGKYTIENVIGRSKRMQQVFAEVHQAAPGRSTVLLRGESGTGKEVIARAIHTLSNRHDGPFVKVNCAALPESLLESELFGHEKGAFTGATQERKGRFEMAHGGTLFLDEIGDISPGFQAKLLRVLQEREFERVGGNRTIRVDVRLITATNRNLEEAVTKGEFRADLYFRINVLSIFLPALRERREDIPLLVEHFVERVGEELGRDLRVSPEAMHVMANCHWPGNVRELENCVERMATMARGNVIRDSDLACQKNLCFSSVFWKPNDHRVIPIVNGNAAASAVSSATGATPGGIAPPTPVLPVNGGSSYSSSAPVASAPVVSPVPPVTVDEADFGEPELRTSRERLVSAMEQCGWVQAKAARLLGLTPRQIGYALKKYNVEVKRL